MKRLPIGLSAALLALMLGTAHAGQTGSGLVAPAADTLWPQWQARITVLSASTAPLGLNAAFDTGARGLQGGAILGDYVFASPSFGSFRASGGLMSGHLGGLPMANTTAGPRLGVSVQSSVVPAWAPGSDAPAALPYLGLGFSGAPGGGGLALTADFGLVAERPAAAAGVGRAIFGTQGLDRSVRELRLSPVMQLGVRYTF